jgi:hypothetical protein
LTVEISKTLFGLGEGKKIWRRSISERLSKINPDYFKDRSKKMNITAIEFDTFIRRNC